MLPVKRDCFAVPENPEQCRFGNGVCKRGIWERYRAMPMTSRDAVSGKIICIELYNSVRRGVVCLSWSWNTMARTKRVTLRDRQYLLSKGKWSHLIQRKWYDHRIARAQVPQIAASEITATWRRHEMQIHEEALCPTMSKVPILCKSPFQDVCLKGWSDETLEAKSSTWSRDRWNT